MKHKFVLLAILILLLGAGITALAQDTDTPVPSDEPAATLDVSPAATDEVVDTAEPAVTQEVIIIVTQTPAESPTPTLTPTPEMTATPLPPVVAIPPSQDVTIAGVNAFYAFIAGLGVGGLGVAGVLLLGVTVILRSPVLLTAIEGLVYSKLDTDGIKNLRGVGTVLDKAGELIDKVTDGLPNEPAGTQVTVTTTPGTSAG